MYLFSVCMLDACSKYQFKCLCLKRGGIDVDAVSAIKFHRCIRSRVLVLARTSSVNMNHSNLLFSAVDHISAFVIFAV